MIMWQRYLRALIILASVALTGCASVEENTKKNVQLGLITTPATYYTTPKARYLGERYKSNLDRLVERIVRDPKTANLQFANNIASVGGIGFFTHSAASSVDERFLEVIMGVSETFDSKVDHNAKVQRIFSLYGAELLSILSSDSEIYQEKEVSGYGLNLSWRNLASDGAGPRISLERSILYFPKARVRSFLRGDLSQNILLGEAVIFAVVEDGPMKLVSYQPQELKPDSRSPIQEEPLVAGRTPTTPETQSEKTGAPSLLAKRSITAKEEGESSAESLSLTTDNPTGYRVQPKSREEHEDWNETAPAADKPTEVPVASAALIEASKTREPSAIQSQEEARAGKQQSADREPAVSTEQAKSEPQDVPPKVDLASLPASPVLGPSTDAKVEVSLKEQLKEQPMLDSKRAKMAPGEQSAALSPRVLQGFVIQLVFGETGDARRWAETLERRGFAVSLTEVGGSGSVRVRIGNFTARDEAERQLQALRQEGLKGIVLNLPQVYRPEVIPAAAGESGKTLSAVQ
jgi:SPOR domain